MRAEINGPVGMMSKLLGVQIAGAAYNTERLQNFRDDETGDLDRERYDDK